MKNGGFFRHTILDSLQLAKTVLRTEITYDEVTEYWGFCRGC
jgi:hypothetical protein